MEQPREALVVDDERQVREQMVRSLERSGFQCDQAADGDEAYRRATAKRYHAVITDLRMPQRHGHKLCLDLLRLPDPPQVLVLSALSDARLVRDLMSRGVYDVVQKPIDYEVLAAKVCAMVENRRVKPAAPVVRAQVTTQLNLLHRIESMLSDLTDLFADRLDRVFETSSELADPPRAVRDFIRRLAEGEASGERQFAVLPGHEGRKNHRVTCFTTAVAVQVDRRLKPRYEPFKLAIRDLSEGGLRMLHTRATNAEYLALSWDATQLARKQLRVVVKLTRCKPMSPFYDLGGQFVMAD